jgi:hypothetical protein
MLSHNQAGLDVGAVDGSVEIGLRRSARIGVVAQPGGAAAAGARPADPSSTAAAANQTKQGPLAVAISNDPLRAWDLATVRRSLGYSRVVRRTRGLNVYRDRSI